MLVGRSLPCSRWISTLLAFSRSASWIHNHRPGFGHRIGIGAGIFYARARPVQGDALLVCGVVQHATARGTSAAWADWPRACRTPPACGSQHPRHRRVPLTNGFVGMAPLHRGTGRGPRGGGSDRLLVSVFSGFYILKRRQCLLRETPSWLRIGASKRPRRQCRSHGVLGVLCISSASPPGPRDCS